VISLTVQVRDTATPAIKRALETLSNPVALMKVLGKGLETDLRAHFAAKNKQPNKRNWPKQNFWAQIRSATNFTGATNDQATVTVADPRINPHVHGGVVRPKDAKLLAIPVRREAYGVRPSSGLIPGLKLVVFPKSGPALVQVPLTQIKFTKDRRKGREGLLRAKATAKRTIARIMYLLRPSVRIPKDPTALPSDAVLQDKLGQRAEAWLQRNVIDKESNG
jgi:hypothetical protein